MENPNKEQCSEKVYPHEAWGSLYPHRCPRIAVVQRNDDWYCKVHDPEYIKAKDAKQTAEWEVKGKKQRTEFTAYQQCIKINPNNPLAVAGAIGDMHEILKKARQHFGHIIMTYEESQLVSIIDEVLAKIKGGN